MKILKNTWLFLFWGVLVLSGLACFSVVYIVKFADISEENIENILVNPGMYIAVALVFNIVILALTYFGRMKKKHQDDKFYENKQPLLLHFFISAFLLLLIDYLMLLSIKLVVRIHHPFAMNVMEIKTIAVIWLIQLVVVGQFQISFFYSKIILLYQKTSELEESTLKMKYNALQAQLNPHFLFNSLNTLISEIECHPKVATDFARNLSDTYRYVLRFQNTDMVPLQSELMFLNTYIDMYKVRFGDSLDIGTDIPDRYLGMYLPPLTGQVLVENIIKHNVITPRHPLPVRVHVDPKGPMLVVSNRICRKKDDVSTGKGLRILSERYKLISGLDISVQDDGDTFTVKVPLLNHEQD